jgi:tRNA-dihydrouridine synthase
VRIDSGPSSNAGTRRYAVQFAGSDPALSVDALNLALQYGKDIIDGKIQPAQL